MIRETFTFEDSPDGLVQVSACRDLGNGTRILAQGRGSTRDAARRHATLKLDASEDEARAAR